MAERIERLLISPRHHVAQRGKIDEVVGEKVRLAARIEIAWVFMIG